MANSAGFGDTSGDFLWVLDCTTVPFVLEVYLFLYKMVE